VSLCAISANQMALKKDPAILKNSTQCVLFFRIFYMLFDWLK
jgi:hypothetical protein